MITRYERREGEGEGQHRGASIRTNPPISELIRCASPTWEAGTGGPVEAERAGPAMHGADDAADAHGGGRVAGEDEAAAPEVHPPARSRTPSGCIAPVSRPRVIRVIRELSESSETLSPAIIRLSARSPCACAGAVAFDHVPGKQPGPPEPPDRRPGQASHSDAARASRRARTWAGPQLSGSRQARGAAQGERSTTHAHTATRSTLFFPPSLRIS